MSSVSQSSPKSQKFGQARRGFVLASVLLLGVVFISCATAFAWFARLQIRDVLREKKSLENRSMARVLTAAAIAGIGSNTSVSYDSPLQEWFKPFLFSVDDLGTWIAQITPLDDKIPIRDIFLPDGNTLRNEMRYSWDAMWDKLGNRRMGNLVLDFMDENTAPQMGGAERENFINRPPLDMSELLILEEMTPELLYGGSGKLGVSDYCTLWSGGKINLNVAPVHVLEILPGLNETLAERIVDYCGKVALKSTSDLRDVPGLSSRATASMLNLATVNSRYFAFRIDMLENSGGGTSVRAVFDKTTGKIVRWEEI